MSDIEHIKGNILDYIGSADYIIHGCNCYHTMGSGVAKALNDFSGGRLLVADKKTKYGDINKLSSYSKVVGHKLTIYNLYSQHSYGRNGIYVHWKSVKRGLHNIFNELPDESTVLIPPIGCGLAGGERKDFDRALELALAHSGKYHINTFKIIVVEL